MVLLSALTGRMKLDVGIGKPRIVQRKCLAAMEDASRVIWNVMEQVTVVMDPIIEDVVSTQIVY